MAKIKLNKLYSKQSKLTKMKQISAIEQIRKIYPFMGLDCEKFVVAIFSGKPILVHLVNKLTSYCDKYNTKKKDNHTLNFPGLWEFVCSLDSVNTAIFEDFFKDSRIGKQVTTKNGMTLTIEDINNAGTHCQLSNGIFLAIDQITIID